MRVSYKALAEKASLSANSVAERIAKMRREGTIRGFSVEVSPEAPGQQLFALIDMRFAAGTIASNFERELREHSFPPKI